MPTSQKPPSHQASQTTPSERVRRLLKSLETGDKEPFSAIHPDRYIQHNLAAGDGVAGLNALLGSLPPGSIKVNTARVFHDGDFVFAHSDLDFFGPKVGFDVYRFEDGKIVEHWDNLQEAATKPNPSHHTMLDGPTQATDLDKTQANKLLVSRFVEEVFVKGRTDKFATYIDGENYTQHNPQIGDGLSGVTKAFEGMKKAGIAITYDRVHKVLGQGNFVLAISEGQFGGKHVAFYDLFRVAAGKLVEHWDTIENVPPRPEWKNQNGKFGFDAPGAEGASRPTRPPGGRDRATHRGDAPENVEP